MTVEEMAGRRGVEATLLTERLFDCRVVDADEPTMIECHEIRFGVAPVGGSATAATRLGGFDFLASYADVVVMRDPAEVRRRLRSKCVRNENGCLLFTGALDPSGYAAIRVDGRKVNAHRVAWELAHGPIPASMCVHHVCHRRACTAADHLALVDRATNSSMQLPRQRRQFCRRGHPLTRANSIIERDGRRRCRTCRRRYSAAWQRARRAQRGRRLGEGAA